MSRPVRTVITLGDSAELVTLSAKDLAARIAAAVKVASADLSEHVTRERGICQFRWTLSNGQSIACDRNVGHAGDHHNADTGIAAAQVPGSKP